MLSPFFCNSAQLDSFKQGNETYVMMTFFFHSPPNQPQTWRPPVEFMPAATIIMPRRAYKDIVTKFLGYMSRQDEPNPANGKEKGD